MPRKPKVYTVRSCLINRETGEEREVCEMKETIDADGNVAIIQEEWYMPKDEWQAYVEQVGKRLSENLSDTMRETLLRI